MLHHVSRLTLAAVACAALFSTTNTAQAHDAEDVAVHCVRYVNHLVDRCTNAVADTTIDCIQEIHRLQEAGEHAAARRLARECIGHIQNLTDNCSEAIIAACVRCTNVLINEFGAEELAWRVRYHCADALEDLARLERRAINAILDQFE